MFNTTQKVEQKLIDERILPTTGLISIFQIMRYCGIYSSRDYVEQLIESLKKNGVRIIETDQDSKKWLVCLGDFTKNNEVK